MPKNKIKVALFTLNPRSGKKFYCFEAGLIFLANHFSDEPLIVNFPHHVSGGDVFNYKPLTWTTQKGLN